MDKKRIGQFLSERRVGDIIILYPEGYITGGPETDELEQALARLAEEGVKRLIINCADVKHFNSNGHGILIQTHTWYVRHGGSMKLCTVDKRIENIFVIMKLSLVFDVYPTEEQAVASYAASTS